MAWLTRILSNRTANPTARDLRAVAGEIARVGALLAGFGLLLQLVRGDRWLLSAPFAFALPPAVSAALLLGAALGWLAARRRRYALAALLVALVVAALAVGRDTRGGSCAAAPGNARLVVWNIRHQLGPATESRLRTLAAEAVILVEADGVAPRRWPELFPEHEICAPGGGILVLAKQRLLSCQRRQLGRRSHAVLAVFDGDPPSRWIGVDIDGHPLGARRRPIEALAALVRDGWGDAVVGGDFNTPRRAWGFDPLRRTHRNAFATAGRGWAGSWPKPIPLLDIDHVWLPRSMALDAIGCARFLSPADSDHRPLVVDLSLAAIP